MRQDTAIPCIAAKHEIIGQSGYVNIEIPPAAKYGACPDRYRRGTSDGRSDSSSAYMALLSLTRYFDTRACNVECLPLLPQDEGINLGFRLLRLIR